MIIVQPKVEVKRFDAEALRKHVEEIGRVCYKSEDKITEDSAKKFIERITEMGHGSILEHATISVKFTVDRGVSHELVRHRIASISQESTRYVNYAKGKYGEQITVVEPFFFVNHPVHYPYWVEAMETAESIYMDLINNGAKPQEARSVLPNSLKTEVWMTLNLRSWLHFLTIRAHKAAHPQMRQVACPLAAFLTKEVPQVFGGVDIDMSVPFAHVGWYEEA